jgi:signal transduction histidine kinase
MFLVTAVVVSELAARSRRQALQATRLAAEQAALRRVATLVARGTPSGELFAAVAEEVGQLVPADRVQLSRFESDGTITSVSHWSRTGDQLGAGARWILKGYNQVTNRVARTGRPARMDGYAQGPGGIAAVARGAGAGSLVGAPIIVEGRFWGVMTASSGREEPLPADTQARLASFIELVATAMANAQSRADLAARIVASADQTRRRIERDLHDGVQQGLVSLVLELRAAQAAVPPELGALQAELSHVAKGLAGLVDELRAISRGIHPAILAEGGLTPALRTLTHRLPIPVKLDVRAEARLPERVEAAVYYVVAEALTNAAKHAQASVIHVDVEALDALLRVCVQDDGVGGADLARGSGLIGLKDRVEALGGTISLHSPTGAGTSVTIELPLDDKSAGIPTGRRERPFPG